MNQPRGRPFQKGNSFGQGRPNGSRNKITKPAQEVLENCSPALISKCIQQAMQGDPTSMRLCIERILPIRRERAVRLKLPKVTDIRSASLALELITKAAAQGKITGAEAESFVKILEARVQLSHVVECMARIEALENDRDSSRPAQLRLVSGATK